MRVPLKGLKNIPPSEKLISLIENKVHFYLSNYHPLYLTDCGTYPQLPTQPKKIVQVQTNTVVFYGHPELSGEEKSKFEFEEKKFSIVLKMEIC